MSEELTAAQAAERLGVGRSTINLWCRQGRLKGARREDSPVGPYWLIPASTLKDFQKPTAGRPKKGDSKKRATNQRRANGGASSGKKGGEK